MIAGFDELRDNLPAAPDHFQAAPDHLQAAPDQPPTERIAMHHNPERLRKLTDSLAELEVDALLITDVLNVSYLSGFTGDSSYLLVQPAGTTILSDGRYEIQIASECPSLTSLIRAPSQLLPEWTQAALNDSGAKRIGIETDHMSLQLYRYLTERCPRLELVDCPGEVEKLRMVKDQNEIETTREAVRIAQRAFESVVPMITEASTERDVAHELEAKMRKLGAEGCSFEPIVAFGASSALPHYRPGHATIGDSKTLLIDWGAKYAGYASDLTRTMHRGQPADSFRRAYETVLEAQMAAIDAIRPGIASCEVDAVARRVLGDAGLGEAFKHGLGHGMGRFIHESPRMSSVSEETLCSGMILTVEPGVYFEDDFGIRIEDDVLVTDSGCEVLSSLPKGLEECRFIL